MIGYRIYNLIFKSGLGCYLIYAILFVFAVLKSNAQILAFPEAEGWGKYTTGGRGGEVIEVTNLNDGGTGSLRYAISTNKPRTIVFRVSGTIELQSELQISYGNLTIAGQTAPGDGICIKNYSCIVKADNVIIRYIRFRPGDNSESDACTGREHKNIILDHCSFSWAVDEIASFYGNENFTMQYCILSESLYNSIHSKGPHGYGGIWGGNKASFHHNMFAHNSSRNPRFNGARYYPGKPELVDFRNNVIYNWGFNSAYAGEPNESDGTKAHINIANNYYKPGPATSTGEIRYRIIAPWADTAKNKFSYFYIDGNVVEGYPEVSNDNWDKGVQDIPQEAKDTIRVLTPFPYDTVTNQSAYEAYNTVLNKVGVTIPRRDTNDARIVYEVFHGTAFFGGVYKGPNTGIIDKPSDVGGWPSLFSAPPPKDADKDGMPDDWEIAKGLNPNDSSDRNLDYKGEGYTNLEYFLNGISQFPVFTKPPDHLTAILTDITKTEIDWADNSNIETSFMLERKSGSTFLTIDTLPANSIHCADSSLQENTKYSYRLRACSAFDTSVYSNEISITTYSSLSPPMIATEPSPDINENDVHKNPVLKWKKGIGSASFDVYFGLTNPPGFICNQTVQFYLPGTLMSDTTYYWRIDGNNNNGLTLGDSWQFRTRKIQGPQLIGHWTLDYYNLIADSTIFNNSGHIFNSNVLSLINNGARNKAIAFNGINQYIKISHHWVYDFEDGSFTLAFWIRQNPSEINSLSEQPYIIKGSISENLSQSRSGKRYEVYGSPLSGNFILDLDDNSVESMLTVKDTAFLKGKWVHVTAVRNVQTKKIMLYANGVLQGETNDNSGDISEAEDLFIGYSPEKQSFMNGALDDIRFYNYALSKNEINELAGISTVINAKTFKREINIYPNPAKDYFVIKLSDHTLSPPHIKIFDIVGKPVKIDLDIIKVSNENQLRINISGLKNGSYLCLVTTDSDFTIKKFTVIN
jgi:hypothetical protein